MTNNELLDCLTERPCDVCKFHKEKGCTKWDCVFDQREQEPKTEWIPVGERLPGKNDIYVVWTSKGFGDHLSTSYYSIDDGWTIGVCAWKENGEPYKESEG